MYLEYFGLSKPPFRITPDNHVFFEGRDRGPTLNDLMFAIQIGAGVIKVVGEVAREAGLNIGAYPHKVIVMRERITRGLIRRISIPADKALLTAYAQGTYHLTLRDIKLAAEDSQYTSGNRRWPWTRATARLISCTGLLFGIERIGSLSNFSIQQIADTITYDH